MSHFPFLFFLVFHPDQSKIDLDDRHIYYITAPSWITEFFNITVTPERM